MLDAFLDRLRPLVVKIASQLLCELPGDMRLVKFILNAGTLGLLDLLLDLVDMVVEANS